MQRTLFDFTRKTAASSTATAAAGRKHSRSPRTTRSGSRDSDADLTRPVKGSSKEDAMEIENSLGVASTSVTADAQEPTHNNNAAPVAETASSARSSSRSPRRAATAVPVASAVSAPDGTACSSGWLAALITQPEWKTFLQRILSDSWKNGGFMRIERFLDAERSAKKLVLPPNNLIFNAFNSCPFAECKVVLLGQDPYHDVGQAHGLCFSVLPGVAPPPSLKNMYKELTTDIPGFQAPKHGYLQSWSEQGMLMLNATLTVEAHKANSHSKSSGWQPFTDAVIEQLSRHHPNRLVFLLWGNSAQQKKKLIDTSRHVVIENVHPSPLSASRGWFGCKCFSACNDALRKMGHDPMYWQLPLNV